MMRLITKQSKINLFAMALAFLIITIGTVSAATVTVGDDSVADYTSIQQAIDNATDDDIIIVYPGNYDENVNVNKPLTIISKSGNPEDTIVQAANPEEHVFHVNADNVIINGFYITGVRNYPKAGIYLDMAEGCTVTNNIASNNDCGIYLDVSNNNTLNNNTASSNNVDIYLHASSHNVLNNNTLGLNNYCCILLYFSSNNELKNNNINLNYMYGIRLVNSNYNTLINNTVLNSINDPRMPSGIMFQSGIMLKDSSNNKLINNTASENKNGIQL